MDPPGEPPVGEGRSRASQRPRRGGPAVRQHPGPGGRSQAGARTAMVARDGGRVAVTHERLCHAPRVAQIRGNRPPKAAST
jgi:hypothetical protein